MKGRLVILDDIFPLQLSSFRIAEFNAYLRTFEDSAIYTSWKTATVSQPEATFANLLELYETSYPELKDRVFEFLPERIRSPDLFYCVFLSNAHRFLDFMESHRTPFVFTLYPGGEFWLDHPRSDAMLSRVCASPWLAKVIVTQKYCRDYLLERRFCSSAKLEFVYGGVTMAEHIHGRLASKIRFPEAKPTIDICFVAYKYMAQGRDKGYPIFVAAAKILAQDPRLRFHVVGNFGPDDLNISELGNQITFYGLRHTDFFAEFYPRMDIILSPNIPYALRPGKIDGFPTGCCIEAGLSGVAVFCTDIMKQNLVLIPGQEFEETGTEPEEIAKQVRQYLESPEKLYALGRAGQQKFRSVFGLEAQMTPRLDLLKRIMEQRQHVG